MEKVILTEQEIKTLLDENAAAMLNDANRSKVYGAESLEPGDIITILPNAEGKLFTGGEYNGNKFLRILCSGDRANVSVSALLGTSKPRKYFATAGYSPEFAEGYDSDKALAEAWKPEARNEKEIVPILCKNYIGAKFTCIAHVEYTANFQGVESQAHFYLFKCEMPKQAKRGETLSFLNCCKVL